MIARGMAFAVLVAAFAPGVLHAQQNPVSDPFYQQLQYQQLFGINSPLSQAAVNRDKLYEDIEILRRILDRKLHSHYVRHHHQSTGKINLNNVWYTPQGVAYNLQNPYLSVQANNAGPMMQQQLASGWLYSQPLIQGNPAWANLFYQPPVAWEEVVTPTLEGVYLKGQGVIYTATLSSLQPTAKAETVRKPVSEWESVRRQLRNEKEEAQKPDANKPLPLSVVLLKVLAENGHHFSQLGENESLTIVLTVHEPSPPTPARKPGESGSTKKSSTAQASGGGSDLQEKVRDLVLLGDLHMKQGHYAEAIAAYQKAVELKPGPKEPAILYRKLAQCYLNLGEDEKGRALLDQAISLRKKAGDEKEKPASPSQATASLPLKLIISAPKKLLDEMKVGRISFEEFRHKASIEALRFNERR